MELLERWNGGVHGRNKRAQGCFFLRPQNVTSVRPTALMPTVIRWWEAVRAPEVAKWKQKYRLDWEGCHGWPKWRSSADSLEKF